MFTSNDKATARVHSGHLNECRPVPGGLILEVQAANLSWSPPVGCYRLNIFFQSLFVLLFSHKADTYFTIPLRVEG